MRAMPVIDEVHVVDENLDASGQGEKLDAVEPVDAVRLRGKPQGLRPAVRATANIGAGADPSCVRQDVARTE